MDEQNDQYHSKRFATRVIMAGQETSQWTNHEVIPPIVTTVTYYQSDPTDIRGYCYSRRGSPTVDVLQRCIASLDKAKHCLVYPSGCAATTGLLDNLKPGDHFLASHENYFGPRPLFETYCVHRGIDIEFFDPTDLELLEKSIKPNTKLIWIEAPTNPCLKICDIAAIAKIAHSRADSEITFAVDNTMMTAYFQRPLDLGADIVLYALSKHMNGHNDVMGGALVTNNTILYDKLKVNLINSGSLLSAFDCYLVNRGLKTLPLRITRHFDNALAIARYLESHPKILKVTHPGLQSHPQYEYAKTIGQNRAGVVLAYVDGTDEQTKKFIQNLKVFICSGSFGSYCSSVMIATYIRREEGEKFAKLFGIFDNTVRLSPGIEDIEDLKEDLDQALKKAFE